MADLSSEIYPRPSTIRFSDFSVLAGSWEYASGSISVDITDSIFPLHSIDPSKCYFEINGTTVSSTTFTAISGGYRMTYNSPDDFTSLLGPFVFTAHGTNDNPGYNPLYFDTSISSVYLTYGYLLTMDNASQDGWDFGYNTGVVVRASAENEASCPIKNAEAFWFETESRPNRHLGASIVGIPAKSELSELFASIYPQSTAFFYGKTYNVVLKVKDFVGNEMEPLEFEFKIEKKP